MGFAESSPSNSCCKPGHENAGHGLGKKNLKNDDPGHNLFSGRVGFLPVGYSNEWRH